MEPLQNAQTPVRVRHAIPPQALLLSADVIIYSLADELQAASEALRALKKTAAAGGGGDGGDGSGDAGRTLGPGPSPDPHAQEKHIPVWGNPSL